LRGIKTPLGRFLSLNSSSSGFGATPTTLRGSESARAVSFGAFAPVAVALTVIVPNAAVCCSLSQCTIVAAPTGARTDISGGYAVGRGLSDDDDLAPIDITASANGEGKADDKKPAVKKPQAILDYEKKNAGKKKIKVRDGNTGG